MLVQKVKAAIRVSGIRTSMKPTVAWRRDYHHYTAVKTGRDRALMGAPKLSSSLSFLDTWLGQKKLTGDFAKIEMNLLLKCFNKWQ